MPDGEAGQDRFLHRADGRAVALAVLCQVAGESARARTRSRRALASVLALAVAAVGAHWPSVVRPGPFPTLGVVLPVAVLARPHLGTWHDQRFLGIAGQ